MSSSTTVCAVSVLYIRDMSRERKKGEREREMGFFSGLFVLGAHHCKLQLESKRIRTHHDSRICMFISYKGQLILLLTIPILFYLN